MNRLYYWDNISGLLILMVVIGHTLSFAGHGDLGLYLYYLPFFFYKSGCLSSAKTLKETVIGGG